MAWRCFPQLTLMAAFVRLGYLGSSQAAALLERHESVIEQALEDLDALQALTKKKRKWLHPDTDFTGVPRTKTVPTPTALQAIDCNSSSSSDIN